MPARAIWALYDDVSTWPLWNDQAEVVTRDGPAGDLVIRVSHRLDPLAGGRLKVTYAAQVDGPAGQAREVGPMITADFPKTMGALIALAARDNQAPKQGA